jgi:hypothetical protein
MRNILTIAVTATVLLLSGSVLSAQRGRQGGPPQLPEQASPQGREALAVPEPATLMLVALGIGAAVGARRLARR